MEKGLKTLTYVEYEFIMSSSGHKLRNQHTEFDGVKTKEEVLASLINSHSDDAVEGSLFLTKLQYIKGV